MTRRCRYCFHLNVNNPPAESKDQNIPPKCELCGLTSQKKIIKLLEPTEEDPPVLKTPEYTPSGDDLSKKEHRTKGIEKDLRSADHSPPGRKKAFEDDFSSLFIGDRRGMLRAGRLTDTDMLRKGGEEKHFPYSAIDHRREKSPIALASAEGVTDTEIGHAEKDLRSADHSPPGRKKAFEDDFSSSFIGDRRGMLRAGRMTDTDMLRKGGEEKDFPSSAIDHRREKSPIALAEGVTDTEIGHAEKAIDKWECYICSFLNPVDRKKCLTCENPTKLDEISPSLRRARARLPHTERPHSEYDDIIGRRWDSDGSEISPSRRRARARLPHTERPQSEYDDIIGRRWDSDGSTTQEHNRARPMRAGDSLPHHRFPYKPNGKDWIQEDDSI